MGFSERFKSEYADRLHAVKTDKYALLSAIICALLFILIVYSFYVRVRMYMLGITLWEDEARLAENIVDRTMRELLTPPLANLQTAPALYLVGVKFLTILFGTSEGVLRVSSFIAMIGLLIAQGLLLRKAFRIRMLYTLFAVALSSIFLYYMQHSNELKPYIGDAAFVLFVLLGYYAYREGLLGKGVRSVLALAAILIVCMLFSSPAVFAAGAVFIVEFLTKCVRRDRKAALLIVVCGCLFIIAFAANYFLWLKPIAENPDMVGYWEGFKLDLNVFSGEAMRHNYSLLKDMLAPIWHYIWLMLPLSVMGFFISLARRNIYTAAAGVFLLITLLASALDKYPIANRLWMFVYVIIFIYCFVFIDALRVSLQGEGFAKAVSKAIPLFLAVLLLAPNFSFPAYGRGEEWTLTPGDQAKPLIEYVRAEIKDGETLYSYETANKILKYENGYHTNRIGDVSEDNIVYGSFDFDGDIARIAETGDTYVLYYHSYIPLSGDWRINHTIEGLHQLGYMDLVMDVYHTLLYWYTNDLDKVRAAATLEVSGLEAGGGRLAGVFHITNTGGTILAHDRFEDHGHLDIVIRDRNGEETVVGRAPSMIRQGESADLWFERDGLEPGDYVIDLVAPGEYAFSELRLEPIPVTIQP